ncbi:MAG: rod-binding protein [Alphaproteobacteria bacterium]|nr:rod-binding protein [Alphaproteobacteria bacterium]
MNITLKNDPIAHVPNTPQQEKDIERGTREFTNTFLKSIFRQVFQKDEESPLFGESHGGEMWRSLWVDQLAETCSGKTGIEPIIKRSLQQKVNPYFQENSTVLNTKGAYNEII